MALIYLVDDEPQVLVEAARYLAANGDEAVVFDSALDAREAIANVPARHSGHGRDDALPGRVSSY